MSQKKVNNQKLKYAVIIAECLNADYDTASAFLELGLCSTLDLTMSWLTDNNIQEIFLFYSTLRTQIEQYYNTASKMLNIKRIEEVHKEKLSIGDVIRQVNFRNLVSQDFLLLHADCVTNVDLQQMTDNHFQKKAELKNVVLTSAFQHGLSRQIYILNSLTSEILQVETDCKALFSLNTQKISLKRINAQFRRDLVPVDIHICTIEVVKSFKQNNEYETMLDFISGMLTSDVYEQKINAYVMGRAQRGYRINKAGQMYAGYMSYICHYLYPYTIDSESKSIRGKAHDRQSNCSVRDYGKIIRKGTKIAASCKLSHNVYFGSDTTVGEGCQINKSIIGNHCVINAGAKLEYCVVLDGCVLSPNSHYQYCLIEKVNEVLKIHTFRNDILDEYQVLIEKDIFPVTPPSEQNTLQEDIISFLADKSEQQTVSEMLRIRKSHNKSLHQFTLSFLKISKPQGIKGIEKFMTNWGAKLQELHQTENEFISSLYFACLHCEDYSKAFHLLLQYCYHLDLLSKESLLHFSRSQDVNNTTIKLCAPFFKKLTEESDDQDSEEEKE